MDKFDKITKDMLEANEPECGVGLLFMCYQSSIEDQFEVLQGDWANTGKIGKHELEVNDSIIAEGPRPAKELPKQWGQPEMFNAFTFNQFVTMRGGEYFFTPSLPFLKALKSDEISGKS